MDIDKLILVAFGCGYLGFVGWLFGIFDRKDEDK